MTKLLERLIDSPDAYLLMEEAQKKLLEETQQRKDFYNWIREDQKAEFINGQIIMHSPVMRRHWKVVMLLSKLLDTYAALHDLGEVATEKALVALTRNDYEPDVCFWSKQKSESFTEEMMQHPAPDLVVEVLSKGTIKRDRGVKFIDYAAHSIQEYWIIDTSKKEIDQYFLNDDRTYNMAGRFEIGDSISSKSITGFTIPVLAIFDSKENLQTLQTLIRQP